MLIEVLDEKKEHGSGGVSEILISYAPIHNYLISPEEDPSYEDPFSQDSLKIHSSLEGAMLTPNSRWFVFFLGSFFFQLIYYLPIWFQGVKGASAVKSGIMNLPMVLCLVLVSILAGIGVTVVGYCKPSKSCQSRKPLTDASQMHL
jgi:hypothetical protein